MAAPSGKLRLYAPSLVTLALLLPFFAYYVRQVKAQEGFMNARAFRVLEVASRQFAAAVKGAADTMDAAVRIRHEFAVRRESKVLNAEAQKLSRNCPTDGDCALAAQAEVRGYLHAFLIDSLFVDYKEEGAAESGNKFILSRHAGVSPAQIRLEVRRPLVPSGGTPAAQSSLIVAALDPARLLKRAVGQKGAEVFDTVLLATDDGGVIAQTANPVANVREMEALLTGKKTPGKAPLELPKGDSGKSSARSAAAGGATQLAGAEGRVEVEISGEPYLLFSIPVQITLSFAGSSSEAPLVLYGLARKDAWEARAMQLPSLSVPALLLTLIMGMSLLWPVLQLQTMSPRVRLLKTTLAFMVGSSLLAAVVFAALVLVAGFALRLNHDQQAKLESLSGQIRDHFAWETAQAIHTTQQAVHVLASETQDARPADPRLSFHLLSALLERLPKAPSAAPAYLLRRDLLDYPYFVHIILTSNRNPGEPSVRSGLERQIIKLSTDPVPTPLIDLPVFRFPFVDRLLNGPYATLSAYSGQAEQNFTIESLLSPNTGEFLPTLMFYPGAGTPKGSSGLKPADYRVMVATQLPSLVKTILPHGFGFAVVNDGGQVLFHSDTARNLRENFYGESSDPAELEKSVLSRVPGPQSMRYGGRNVAMYVQPLAAGDTKKDLQPKPHRHDNASGGQTPSITNLGLTLIVYYDSDETNELFSALGFSFLTFTLGPSIALLLLIVLWNQLRGTLFPTSRAAFSSNRLWPWDREKQIYLLEGIWGGAWFLVALAAATFCPMETADYEQLPSPPHRVLALLSLALLISVAGLILSWRKHHWATWAANRPWLLRLKEHVPLSAAFSLRLFSIGLVCTGILTLGLFQFALWRLQRQVHTGGVTTAASAMEKRKERNVRAWSASSASSAECLAQDGSGCLAEPFRQARLTGAGIFDVYDAHACPETKGSVSDAHAALDHHVEQHSHSESAHLVPESAPQPSSDGQPARLSRSHAGVLAAGPCGGPKPITTTWRGVPGLFADNHFHSLAIGFNALVLLTIALLFLWKHFLVRRLFILDFRPPEPWPTTNETVLGLEMERAILEGGRSGRRRWLIFAHPKSDTSKATRHIVAQLKEKRLISANFSPLDCPTLLGGRPEDEGGWRKAVIKAQASGHVAILDNFATGLVNTVDRRDRLAMLEAVVFPGKAHVYLITSVDPLLFIQSLLAQKPADEATRLEFDRWVRVLSSFERFAFEDSAERPNPAAEEAAFETLFGRSPAAHPECFAIFKSEMNAATFLRGCIPKLNRERLDWSTPRHFERTLVTQVRSLADGYYRVVWLNCTADERLALFQLAKDDWMNPLNKVGITHALRKKLITAVTSASISGTDGAYRIMNESFRQFVLGAVQEREAIEWAAEPDGSLWPAMRMALMLAVGLLILFMAYIQRELFDVYFSYFAALAGGSAALLRIVMQLFSREDAKLTAALGGKSSGGAEKA